MKINDYKQLINKLVAKPEEAPAVAEDLLKNITDDCAVIDSLNSKVNEQQQKILDLQNTNIKLFLGQTSKPAEEPDPEPAPSSIDDIVKKLGGAFNELKQS